MEATRIFDLLPRYEILFKHKENVLAGKVNGKWVLHDIIKYRHTANCISFGLLKLGVEKGDKIATISNNRPEWNFVDMGIMQIGAVHVPIYPTISSDDYQYILQHAGVKFVFVSGKEIIRKTGHIIESTDNIKDVYTFDEVQGYKNIEELIQLGSENQVNDQLESIEASISKDDVATLIYIRNNRIP